jgi:hypothetical protein
MRSVANLWYAMPVLTGRRIRLEPLAVEHAPGYLAAAGTGAEAAEVSRWLSPPRRRHWPRGSARPAGDCRWQSVARFAADFPQFLRHWEQALAAAASQPS